jgi:CHC2 zinc finger
MSPTLRKSPTTLPRDWRERLPLAFKYYPKHVKDLGEPGGGSIAKGNCPLHDDYRASLSVNLDSGHWYCPCCGGGTLTIFHQRLTGLPWNDAVVDLIKTTA